MAEGSETPNGEQGLGPEGRPRRGEGDLLAERRARRAAESGEAALLRRTEAAEATVHTLERHVASLQQRLREMEGERERIDELLEAERAAALEREHELRRVKQREYAEQQLRIETEDRMLSLDRESRVEVERLDARLSDSEKDARELARRLEGVQRQLAEAEQEAAAKRALASAEQGMQARLDELERRAREIQQGLDAERAARERSERLLESMREGHRRLELLLADMKGIVARVTAALSVAPSPEGEQRTQGSQAMPAGPQGERLTGGPSTIDRPSLHADALPTGPPEARGAEMAEALAAAVERLRARAAAAGESEDVGAEEPPPHGAGEPPRGRAEIPPSAPAPGEPAPSTPAGRGPAGATPAPSEPVVEPPAPRAPLQPHKHSMSLFGRVKMRRKQRRER